MLHNTWMFVALVDALQADGSTQYVQQDFPKVEQLMDAFRRVLVNNSDIDTELPYFVGVQSLENHSINVCLHVSGSSCETCALRIPPSGLRAMLCVCTAAK